MTEMEKHIHKLTTLADDLLALSNRLVPSREVEPHMYDSCRAIRCTLEETVASMRKEIAKQERIK